MKPWLFRISLSHLNQYPGRTLLGIMGIALGTAVYLSISLAAASAVKSFQAGVAAVAGKAQWRVQSPGAPLDESLFTRLRRLPEVKAAAPVVESVLELSGPLRGPVLLLGIDPFSEFSVKDFRDYEFVQGGGLADQTWVDFLTRPDAVLVSERLAARLSLKVGDSLPVLVGPARESLSITGIFRAKSGLYPLDGAVVLMDIAAAQELLDRVGRLDYLDLVASGDEAQVLARLQAELPPGVEVVRPGAQGRRTEGLVAAYRLNLAVLSAIALFVGMFLIYQSVTLSVVRRRREIGLLRTLGMTPAQVLLLFLAEGVVSGLVGGALGLILGVGLARGVLGVMTQNLTSLYMPVAAEEVWVQGGLLLQAWGLAVAATLVAAALPALEAARTHLRAVWYREELEEKLEGRVGLITWWGLLCLALAAALASWKVGPGPPWPGFAASFLILLGFALLTPLSARLLGQRLEGLLQKWPAAGLGCRYLGGSLSRVAVSIAALACALGMLIAVTVMIGSFRQTVNDWVSRAISGDIFFGPAVFSTAAYDQYLPPEILPELQRDPEIADLYLYRCVRLPFRDRDILVIGGSFQVLAKHGGLWFRRGETQAIMQKVGGGGQAGTGETPANLRPAPHNPPCPPLEKGGLKSPPFLKGDLGGLGGYSESAKVLEPNSDNRKPETENRKQSVVISEPLAEGFHLQEGDTFTLPTPSGPQEVMIAGVFYDYRTDGPSVWMDISQFRRFWQDTHLNAVRLYLKDPARTPQVQARLQEKYGGRYRLLALSHRELRRGILKIFDETFALTYALEGVAMVVAIFGIITTFLVLIMERQRDLALLQAIGASRRQILGMVLTESGLASFLSFILGAASGSALSLLLIKVINKQAFGWTIMLHWTPGIYWQSLLLVMSLGLAAAAYPAWRAIQPHLAEILKEE
ncbi:MAG: ABC transporter permease [Deltaproteobacteria bacterium]|nr:ABC transporter permease [Deltaproteobacteria bacterium]